MSTAWACTKSMTREEAFKVFDRLLIRDRRFEVGRHGFYRILMDMHGIDRKEAFNHWTAYEKSDNFKLVLKLIPDDRKGE